MDEIKVCIRGIDILILESNLNDFELMELLADAADNDVTVIAKFCRKMFGEEQWNEIKEKLREQNNGRLPIVDTWNFVQDALAAATKETDALKN